MGTTFDEVIDPDVPQIFRAQPFSGLHLLKAAA